MSLLLLIAGPVAGRLALADEGQITGTNRLEIWATDSLWSAAYLNQLDILYAGGHWLVGARMELDEETTRWDKEQGIEIPRRYAEYREDIFRLRAGTFYTTFGRGMLLRAMEDEEVRVDRDIDGVYGGVSWKWLEAQGLVGRPRNDDTHRRDDLLSGIDLEAQVTSSTRIGGGYVRLDASGEAGDPDLGRPIEEITSGRLQWTHGPVDAFLEGATRILHGKRNLRGEWKATDAEDGHAWYGSLSFCFPGYTMLFEGKNYLRFDAPYSTLPPVNNEGQPINDGQDERGLGMLITASPSTDLTIECTASWAEATDGEAERSDAKGMLRKDWWNRGSLQFSGEWTKEKMLEGHDEREYYGPSVDASYYLNPTLSLQLTGYVYARNDSVFGGRDEYTEVSTDLTLSHASSRSVTLSMIKASEPIREYGKDDLWLSLQVAWTFDYSHDLLIKIGKERGGIVCSGGLCHYEPPFSGVRVELVSRL